jgi:hypothetical protein
MTQIARNCVLGFCLAWQAEQDLDLGASQISG